MWTSSLLPVVIYSFMCGLFIGTISACDTGWFGTKCQYKCHCVNDNCDNDGFCSDGSICDKGWFGPACQYVNLAVSAKSNVPSLIDEAGETCDGDLQSMVENVIISFPAAIPFTWMRIEVKDYVLDPVPSLRLQFLEKNLQSKGQKGYSPIDCKNQRSALVTHTTMDIHCQLDVAVEQVILSGEGVKSLCSVRISGGRNVALKQYATQSTTYKDFLPAKAVDGNVESRIGYGNATCSHTHGTFTNRQSWRVKLDHPQFVNRYVIYNREDCCKGRLIGFELESFAPSGETVFQHKGGREAADPVVTIVSPSVTQPASTVKITAMRRDRRMSILTLCEVEVFGDSACPKGLYGFDCDKTCNCRNKTQACFVSTGGCPSGCPPGIYGEGCQDGNTTNTTVNNSFNIKIGIAVAVAVLIICVIAAVIIGLWCRKMKTTPTTINQCYDEIDVNQQDVQPYLMMYKDGAGYDLPRDRDACSVRQIQGQTQAGYTNPYSAVGAVAKDYESVDSNYYVSIIGDTSVDEETMAEKSFKKTKEGGARPCQNSSKSKGADYNLPREGAAKPIRETQNQTPAGYTNPYSAVGAVAKDYKSGDSKYYITIIGDEEGVAEKSVKQTKDEGATPCQNSTKSKGDKEKASIYSNIKS